MAIYAAYQHDVTNESGDLLTNVQVRVTNETDGSLPQLYDGPNSATATALGNPYTQADGKVYFHCVGGSYKIVLTSGAYTRTLRYIPIGRAGETDLTVTTPMGLWAVGTTYGAGDLVSYTGSKLFISLVDSNLANTPDATTPGDTAYWMYIGVAASPGVIGDWQGAWVTATAYALNDAVSYDGSSYICLEAHTSGTFATDLAAVKWELVAQKGNTGASGAGTSSLTVVRVVDTTGAAIATAYENGDTIDGVVLVTGDLVLRATSGGNASDGVYTVPASGAASRHASFDTYDEHPGCYFSVMEGTTYADTLWRCTSNKGGTLGATALVFAATESAFMRTLLDDTTATEALGTLGISTGVWTPTLTNVTNVDASTAFECHYIRVGGQVHCWGQLNIDPTAGGNATTYVRMSLPIASNFAASSDAQGICTPVLAAQRAGSCDADSVNDAIRVRFLSEVTANTTFAFIFDYSVI